MSDLENQFQEIQILIENAKNNAFKAINNEIIKLYWNIGEYINNKLKSSEWGDKVVSQLADYLKRNKPDLTGFEKRSIYRMVQFYQTYSQNEIVSMMSTQLNKNLIKKEIELIIGRETSLGIVSQYIKKHGYKEVMTSYIEEQMISYDKDENNFLELHKSLLDLPWNNVYTRNYDSLLEQADEKRISKKHTTVRKAEELSIIKFLS